MASTWYCSTIEQRKMKLGFWSMNLVVRSVDMAGPAISGILACCNIGAKAATLPLFTVPMTTDTRSLLISRWTRETARCGFASSL